MPEIIQNIPLRDILRGDNDRKLFKADELTELALSIHVNGLAQPITLSSEMGVGLHIVAGERRFRAFCLLHDAAAALGFLTWFGYDIPAWDTIPALVRFMTPEKADAIMLAENILRKDLDVIEEAQAYQKRMARYGWTVKQCAETCHVKEGRVRDRLKLLNLLPEVQLLVRHGHFPIGHALAMTDLNKNYQLRAVELMKGQHLTQVQFGVICAELYAKQTQMTMFDEDTLFLEMQQVKQDLLTPAEDDAEAVLIPNSRVTIYLVIQKVPGQTVQLDMSAIAQAIQVQEA